MIHILCYFDVQVGLREPNQFEGLYRIGIGEYSPSSHAFKAELSSTHIIWTPCCARIISYPYDLNAANTEPLTMIKFSLVFN
jgi:hypothetical protein